MYQLQLHDCEGYHCRTKMNVLREFSILVICIVIANTNANRLTDGMSLKGDYGNDDDTLRQQLEQNQKLLASLKKQIQQLEGSQEEKQEQLARRQEEMQQKLENQNEQIKQSEGRQEEVQEQLAGHQKEMQQKLEDQNEQIKQSEGRQKEMQEQFAGRQEEMKQQLDAHERELQDQKHQLVKFARMLLMGRKDDNIDPATHNISKREIPSAEYPRSNYEELLTLLLQSEVTGPPGRDGRDGEAGRDGEDGEDGNDGKDGRDGKDGANGDSGIDGRDGKDGAAGPPGSAGPTGIPGIDGIVGPEGPQGLSGADSTAEGNSGAVYTRWGRTNCPSDSTLVYEGFAGSSHHQTPGGGTNYQCLPTDPEYDKYSGNINGWIGAWMAGAEYQSFNYGVFQNSAYNQNVPCARCYTRNRAAVMMIPAKRTCPDDWIKEYEGYLMTERDGHAHPSTFECVDSNPEYITGLSGNSDGALFQFVKASCSGVSNTGHCPPYLVNWELTCVVCTQ